MVTRPGEQALELAASLSSAGFEALILHVLGLVHLEPGPEEEASLDRLAGGDFDWVVFTSANGVRRLSELSHGLPEGCALAVQGEKTARALQEIYGRSPDLIPSRYDADHLLQALAEREVAGKRILIVGASGGREVLADGLPELGALSESLRLYRSEAQLPPASELEALRAHSPEELVFTFFSPSALRATWVALSDDHSLIQRATIAAIGPTTARTAHSLGLSVGITADTQSAEGLVKALMDTYKPS